jgi:hypothetical protein
MIKTYKLNTRTKRVAFVAAAIVGLLLMAAPVPTGQSAPNVTLTASVQNQACQGGDFVNVTLTGHLIASTAQREVYLGLQ